MRNRKTQNAEFLFESIGMLDDKIIAEAETPYAARIIRSARKKTRSLLAACAVLIITGGIFGSTLYDRIQNGIGANTPDQNKPETLVQILSDAADNPSVQSIKAEDINFFTPTPQIIWQFEGQSDYYVVEVTYRLEEIQLKNELKQEGTQLSPDDAEQIPLAVWISYGDGTVVSPYLKNTAGNRGYANLFDYSPEVEPGSSFTELVNDLLS